MLDKGNQWDPPQSRLIWILIQPTAAEIYSSDLTMFNDSSVRLQPRLYSWDIKSYFARMGAWLAQPFCRPRPQKMRTPKTQPKKPSNEQRKRENYNLKQNRHMKLRKGSKQ